MAKMEYLKTALEVIEHPVIVFANRKNALQKQRKPLTLDKAGLVFLVTRMIPVDQPLLFTDDKMEQILHDSVRVAHQEAEVNRDFRLTIKEKIKLLETLRIIIRTNPSIPFFNPYFPPVPLGEDPFREAWYFRLLELSLDSYYSITNNRPNN